MVDIEIDAATRRRGLPDQPPGTTYLAMVRQLCETEIVRRGCVRFGRWLSRKCARNMTEWEAAESVRSGRRPTSVREFAGSEVMRRTRHFPTATSRRGLVRGRRLTAPSLACGSGVLNISLRTPLRQRRRRIRALRSPCSGKAGAIPARSAGAWLPESAAARIRGLANPRTTRPKSGSLSMMRWRVWGGSSASRRRQYPLSARRSFRAQWAELIAVRRCRTSAGVLVFEPRGSRPALAGAVPLRVMAVGSMSASGGGKLRQNRRGLPGCPR
jgi:hypothetical protein